MKTFWKNRGAIADEKNILSTHYLYSYALPKYKITIYSTAGNNNPVYKICFETGTRNFIAKCESLVIYSKNIVRV